MRFAGKRLLFDHRWSLLLATMALMTGCTTPFSSDLPSKPIMTAAPPTPAITAPNPAPPAQVAAKPGSTIPSTTKPGTTKPKPPAPDFSTLEQDLQSYLDQQSGTYGVYVIDLATGKSVGVNADEPFPAASTFKLPMAMYVLDQVQKGKASLDDHIAYTADDYEDGTGTLQDTIQDGDQLSVRELLTHAIEDSDNIATNMLLGRFSRNNVFAFMHQLGGQVTMYDDESVGTTPREMATYMKLAQGNQVIKDASLRQFLFSLLTHTDWGDRVAGGVPAGVTVAHKIGTLPNVVNDVGLVYEPQRRFVVAVFSEDVDNDTAPDIIGEVTRRVYAVEHDLALADPATGAVAQEPKGTAAD